MILFLEDYNNRSYGRLTTYMSLEESTPLVEKCGNTVSLSIRARILKSEKCPDNECKIVVADLKRSDVYLLIDGLIEALSKSDIQEGKQLDANAGAPVHHSILDLMVRNFDSLTSPCSSSKIACLLIELAQELNKNQQRQWHVTLDQHVSQMRALKEQMDELLQGTGQASMLLNRLGLSEAVLQRLWTLGVHTIRGLYHHPKKVHTDQVLKELDALPAIIAGLERLGLPTFLLSDEAYEWDEKPLGITESEDLDLFFDSIKQGLPAQDHPRLVR